MASRITPSRQRNAVSEGAALGFLPCKIDRIRFEKWRVDLAFEGAWRSWTYRSRFSQVNTDLTHGLDGYIAMTRAGERSHTSTLYWTRERELTIWWRHEHWDPHNHDDLAWTRCSTSTGHRRQCPSNECSRPASTSSLNSYFPHFDGKNRHLCCEHWWWWWFSAAGPRTSSPPT